MDDEPFAEERWRASLAFVLEDHELDQLAGIDAALIAEFLADVAGLLVGLVKTRDRGMPEALNAVERAELAALRKTNRLMEVTLAQKEGALALVERRVVDLEILLEDARAERDRAVRVSTEVFVLSLEDEYEGVVKIIGVCASEQAAVSVAQQHFEENYSGRRTLGEWVNGVAHFLYREDGSRHSAGDRSGHCFLIKKHTVLVE